MMLPGTAMRDIMMNNVMSPLINIFRSGRVERSAGREEGEATDGWSRERRRLWWRSLGELASSKSKRSVREPGVFTDPLDSEHVTLSRRKRTVGLYSYAPWLTNDVRLSPAK